MVSTVSVRSVAVGRQLLRVDVRPARRLLPASRQRSTPLLLINGIGASLELLQPFVDELDPALEVIRFDVPGVGGSPLPAAPYRFSGLCGLIARMLAALGHDRADVLGISWGGGVAQHFAAFQRARCRRLVLVSTATGALMVPARPAVLARMVTPRRYLDRRLPRAGRAGPVRRDRADRARAGEPPRCTPATGSGPRAVTCTSSPPGLAGRACRSCRCCGSRR